MQFVLKVLFFIGVALLAGQLDSAIARSDLKGFQAGARSSLASVEGASSPVIPRAAGTKFRECVGCPQMVVIPKGKYLIGFRDVPKGANRSKTIEVDLRRNFAVGVYDVTVSEYAHFISETGYPQKTGCEILNPLGYWIDDPKADWRNPTFAQSGRHPVVCVSWLDAQAYIAWLNAKIRGEKSAEATMVRGPYRLMTVEEYSYVARAGNSVPKGQEKFWRNYANLGAADCWPCGSAKRGLDRWYYTSPVGAFPANSYGLYDTTGNVWSLLADCKIETTDGAPTDGSAFFAQGDCRVREGAWSSWDDTDSYQSDDAPFERRSWMSKVPWGGEFLTDVRNYANGFRVARTLE